MRFYVIKLPRFLSFIVSKIISLFSRKKK
ncbi:MAG: stage V sporulation protein SpoVM [Acholeplasmataceae bacterium]|nr:stage V sporulation protein SpoVM [Acholeplasmataceae bacterium]